MRVGWTVVLGIVSTAAAAAAQEAAPAASAAPEVQPQFTMGARQARRARSAYRRYCEPCHGEELAGLAGSALVGADFQEIWGGQTAFILYEYARLGMPRDDPGAFSQSTYENATLYILQVNGFVDASDGATEVPLEDWSQIELKWDK